MDKDIKDKERVLERLKLDDEIETQKMSISQKKAVEAQMRKTHGRDWKKLLNIGSLVRPNMEVVHDLYSVNPELKELSRPGPMRKLG